MSAKKPYCLMPWIHFHVSDNGDAKACCVANIKFGNVNTQSVSEIWSGENIQKLREKFVAGTPDKRCAHCYKLEESGATSIRQETHENYADHIIHYSAPALPIYFDIRFSNVCNLKCRTCWHGASSSWFEDAKKLKTNKGQKAIIKNIHDFESFIQKTGDSLKGSKEIYFAGGEPLVTEEHYLLLDWLLKENATGMKLRYNTNFTILKYKGKSILDYWKRFKNVEVLASLDASDDLAAYVRTNSDWADILLNFNQVKGLPHISLKIAPTLSVLNIEFIPELIQSCIAHEAITEDDIYINILERPIHYNIQIFPISLKNRISTKLKEYKASIHSNSLKSQIQEIITYMEAKDLSDKWSKFITENKKIDDLRNEKSPLDYSL